MICRLLFSQTKLNQLPFTLPLCLVFCRALIKSAVILLKFVCTTNEPNLFKVVSIQRNFFYIIKAIWLKFMAKVCPQSKTCCLHFSKGLWKRLWFLFRISFSVPTKFKFKPNVGRGHTAKKNSLCAKKLKACAFPGFFFVPAVAGFEHTTFLFWI